MKAFEITGAIDEKHQLRLDKPLSDLQPGRVRVIIVPEKGSATEVDEREWMRSVAANPAFDFLKDPEEDIYTIEDGKPFK